jgi:N-acetylneuraminate synthase
MEIFGKPIGGGAPVFVVAEAGVNHNGDLSLAKELIDVAAASGVDAVKFQTLNAARYISRFAPKADYQLVTTDQQETQLSMVQQYELNKDQHLQLMEHCAKAGVIFFSTPFEESAVDLLEDIGTDVYKIPSGEITNLPFLTYVGRKRKPIILSTGMSALSEVETAVRTIQAESNAGIILLHCVSNYPSAPSDSNLLAMSTMEAALKLPVGYSDHTPGVEVSVAAVALGACVIEKHYTLDREMVGPDHKASLVPMELRNLVDSIRNVEQSLGDGVKRAMASEANTRSVARKSLVAAGDLRSGTALSKDHLVAKRPGTGISPAELRYVLGRKITRDLVEDEILGWDDLV